MLLSYNYIQESLLLLMKLAVLSAINLPWITSQLICNVLSFADTFTPCTQCTVHTRTTSTNYLLQIFTKVTLGQLLVQRKWESNHSAFVTFYIKLFSPIPPICHFEGPSMTQILHDMIF